LDSLVDALRASPQLANIDLDAARLAAGPQCVLDAIRASAPGRSLFLIVDQFEEIFTLCEQATIRESFANVLVALLADPTAAHRIILTMRSDFEPRLSSLPDLQQLFDEKRTVLRATPLTRAELREAIEAPARAVGLRFHKEVVEALLKDVGDEISALPLLQFTLRKLWDTKARDRITLPQYNKLKGAKGALAQCANEFYESLLPEEQTIAKRAFLRMVRLGEGLEVTSARIRVSSLHQLGYPQARVDRVVEKLIQSGLVRATTRTKSDEDQIEVSHEALVRNWQRFVRWLEKDRASLLIRRRLDDKTTEWVRLGSGTAGLLDEVQLDEADEWLKTADAKALGFHPMLPSLVQKSKEAIDTARQDRERAEELLRDQTQRASEEERRRLQAEEQLETEKRLLDARRLADAEQVRAETQAKVARRMRRIARLALVQNTAIYAGVLTLLLVWNDWVESDFADVMIYVLFFGGLALGPVVLLMAFPAIMSSQQPEPSAGSFIRRSVARVVAGAQRLLEPGETPSKSSKT
jgi:hypothetical protein